MLVLEHRIASLFRSAVRKCFNGTQPQADRLPVRIRPVKGGLLIYAHHDEFAVMYRQPTSEGGEPITFPLSTLGLIEGRASEKVEFLALPNGKGTMNWTEGGTPRKVEFLTLAPDSIPDPPMLPKTFEPATSELLSAITEASLTTSKDATKYAMNRIQLRGKKGQIHATDSKQLLIQGGFKFGFEEDLLIPRTGVFGLPAFRSTREIAIGRTKTHVAIRMDNWMIALKIEDKGRFPDASSIVPSRNASTTRLLLHPEDGVDILRSVVVRWRKAGAKDMAITLDLGESSSVRFEWDGRVKETPLTRSNVAGKELRICLDLKQFLRALELQFQEFEFQGPEKPLIARNGERVLVVMPFPAKNALPPVQNPESEAEAEPEPEPQECESLQSVVLSPRIVPHPVAEYPTDRFDVLSEADGLKTGLLKVATHAGRLLSVLRTLCRQPKVVHLVRQSLQFISDCSTSSGDKHELERPIDVASGS